MERLYAELQPSPRLAPWIECYWSQTTGQSRKSVRVLPDGCVDILFAARHGEPSPLSVVGLMTAAATFELEACELFGIRFRPGMASAFIPEAVQLADRMEPLENFWGKRAKFLFDRLASLSNPANRAAAVEQVLSPADRSPVVDRVLRSFPGTAANLDEAIESTGISTRQFRRVCVQRTGVAPKYLSRILRFRKAVKLLERIRSGTARPGWASLAVECGYFDQAHLIREFQEFAGRTPGRYIQSVPAADQ